MYIDLQTEYSNNCSLSLTTTHQITTDSQQPLLIFLSFM